MNCSAAYHLDLGGARGPWLVSPLQSIFTCMLATTTINMQHEHFIR